MIENLATAKISILTMMIFHIHEVLFILGTIKFKEISKY